MGVVLRTSIRRGVQGGVIAALLMALSATGCVTTGSSLWESHKKPVTTQPCQVVCTWQNNVHYAPDPTRGGAPGPGYAGRIYLFGPNLDFPVVDEGSLVIDLYEDAGEKPRMLERWNIDAQTVKRLEKKDMIGHGFTVFLPTSTFRKDLTKIKLRTGFQSLRGGAPIYTENSVTLDETNGVIRQGGPMTMQATQPSAMPTPPPIQGGNFSPGPRIPVGGSRTLPMPTMRR